LLGLRHDTTSQPVAARLGGTLPAFTDLGRIIPRRQRGTWRGRGLTLVAFRVAGGGLILWAYVLLSGLPVPRSPKVWGAFLVMGVLNNVIPFSLIAWGQLRIDSGLAAILNASTAVFAVLVAAAVFADERLTARKFTGVTLGFLWVATALGLSALQSFDLTSLAQLAVLGASVSYAFAGAWARVQLAGFPPQVAAAGMAGFSGIIMSTLAVYFDGIPSFDYAPATWAALIYMALMATAVAYLLYYRVLAMAGSGNLRLATLLIAPVAILLGAFILGEKLESRAFVSFALLAAGMVVLDGRLARKLRPKR
jgi:drug/metabolite transporter (DMT)-like permease